MRSLDARVGANVRAARMATGRRLKDVASLLGVTATQVSEYELGKDRLGAGALFLLARTFGVDVSDFFAGLLLERGLAEEGRPFDREEGGPRSAQATLLAALAVAPPKAQRRAIQAALKALRTPED